jgi:hypothetical protein
MTMTRLTWKRGPIRDVDPEVIRAEDDLPPDEQPVPSPRAAVDPVPDVDPEVIRAEDDLPRDEQPVPSPEAAVDPVPRLREVETAHAQDAAPDTPPVSLHGWHCEIAVWRGGGEAVFYARAFHEGEEIPVAESPPFALVGGGTPEQDPGTVEAHRLLCAELTEAGWVRVDAGPEWYGDRFRRDFSVAALNASLKAHIRHVRRL